MDILLAYKVLKRANKFEIARLLLRCGTTVGANIEEVLAGYSTKDFASKMGIAYKEEREVNYWLRPIKEIDLVALQNINELIVSSKELIKILTAFVKTSQEKQLKNKD